jgi:hypothetical protein
MDYFSENFKVLTPLISVLATLTYEGEKMF